MKKIKILYVGLSDNMGGIETYIYNLYKNIDKNKFEASFMTFKGMPIYFADELKKDGIKFYEVEDRRKSYTRYIKDLKEVYKNNEFDYIHINMMSYTLFERIILACKYSKAKVILHSHNAGYPNEKKYLKSKIMDKIGRMCTSKYINEILKVSCGEKAGYFGFKGDKFTIFNNGVNIDKFSFNSDYRKRLRKILKIKDKETVIGLVAMFNDQKNHSYLIDIFYEYLKLNKKTKLVLVGEGTLQDSIINKVKELNIKEKVIFLGKRTDVNELLSSFDLYLMPSKYEGLSIALVEAQVNGLKCYTSTGVDKTSNITGNVEFISLEENPKKWAEIIYNSNNNRDLNVIHKIPDEFNDKKSYEKVYEFYENNLK